MTEAGYAKLLTAIRSKERAYRYRKSTFNNIIKKNGGEPPRKLSLLLHQLYDMYYEYEQVKNVYIDKLDVKNQIQQKELEIDIYLEELLLNT